MYRMTIIMRCGRWVYGRMLAAVMLLMFGLPVFGQEKPVGLEYAGDFRVRYEMTTNQEPGDTPNERAARNREVVRFRYGIAKNINGLFRFGVRLATGSADDPNSTDITVGEFVNDLQVSMDRAFMEMKYKNLFLSGGKFNNPFRSTEMVWDGDVPIQGVGAGYTFAGYEKIVPRLTGAFYFIDEQTSTKDSYMGGGQVDLTLKPSANLSLNIAGGYYDYTINSLVSANSGDFNSNFLTADGKAYLSDFNLLDIVAALEYKGFSAKYPVRLVGDYVKNNGAATDEDTGYSVDVFVGKASAKKDWRVNYGYWVTENDAVLAAFSHDNTSLSTNYEQHTLALDYVVVDNTVLNVTLYHYRRHNIKAANSIDNDFFTRVRVNVLLLF